MLQPGQINNAQVKAAFEAFQSILAAADTRRKQRNTVSSRQGCRVGLRSLCGQENKSMHILLYVGACTMT
jgi:hypothetical protein